MARDPLLIIGRIDVNLFKAGSKCVLNTRSKCVQKYNLRKNFANGCMYLLSLMAPRLNFSISSVNFNDLPSRFRSQDAQMLVFSRCYFAEDK